MLEKFSALIINDAVKNRTTILLEKNRKARRPPVIPTLTIYLL